MKHLSPTVQINRVHTVKGFILFCSLFFSLVQWNSRKEMWHHHNQSGGAEQLQGKSETRPSHFTTSTCSHFLLNRLVLFSFKLELENQNFNWLTIIFFQEYQTRFPQLHLNSKLNRYHCVQAFYIPDSIGMNLKSKFKETKVWGLNMVLLGQWFHNSSCRNQEIQFETETSP